MMTNLMNQVRCIQEFFDYPKRNDVLTEKIDELSSYGTTRSRTRWVQRVQSFNVFIYLYPAFVAALTHICENEGRHWNKDSMTLASIYLSAIITFSFIMTLKIVQELMHYTKSLTVRLQSKTMEFKCYTAGPKN